ncbi:MAG: metallophosphoesterase [Roseovarius sp.]
MSRLIHLSDLHFGRARPELLKPLIARVNALGADLVVISGDLTQRARSVQFRAAQNFIDALDAPVLVVPGNHDIPLHDPFSRFLHPWRNYRRIIGETLEPDYLDDGLSVLGVNTVNRFVHQSGWFNPVGLSRIASRWEDVGTRTRVIVAHHPLDQRPTDTKKPTRGADHAINTLSELGADIVLSGHLHSWRAALLTPRNEGRAILQVHAGTGLSTRLRGEENDFNLIETEPDRISVTRYAAGAGDKAFEPMQICHFGAGDAGWTLLSGDTS